MAMEEPKLRPRRSLKDAPKLEDVDPKYRDLITALPFEKQWSMRKYKGFWAWERILPGILKMQEFFKPNPNDIIVATFPKSGTTWIKALVFTIVHRDKYNFSNHPLLKLSPHDCVRFIEHTYALLDEQYFETLPSPRVLATHEPYTLLPDSIKTSNSRVIYLCREPKDALVSFWNMIKRPDLSIGQLPFDQTFELFCMGKVLHGPIWDHVLDYYTKSVQDPDKILLLKYEEMLNNPIDGVIRIANFVGCPFSKEEVKNGVIEEIVNFCSFEKMKNLDASKVKGTKNDCFFRKGIVGDWQNHMTPEMAAKLDEITKEKLEGSGFTYMTSGTQ